MSDYDDYIEPLRINDLNSLFKSVKDTSDLYYLSLMLASTQINKDNGILPELIFLLGEDSIQKLLYYYGGETITIPKLSDFRDHLYGMLIYYYYDIKQLSWNKSIEAMGLEYSTMLSKKLLQLRQRVIDGLKDIKIPELKSGDTS